MNGINEHILKLNDRVNIPQRLQRGKRYTITAEIEIRSAEEIETDEENPDMLYKAKFTGDINILSEEGDIFKGRKKGSLSQKYRALIEKYRQQDPINEKDSEEFYNEWMAERINELSKMLL